MHYYTFNIGDFAADTPHLSLLERGVYHSLINAYYRDEAPIPDSKKYRIVGARDESEKEAVDCVLEDFFTRDGDVWRHSRCDKEIEQYGEKREKHSKAGRASAAKKKAETLGSNEPEPEVNRRSTIVEQTLNERSTDVQQMSNQPITNNHKPITNNQEPVLGEEGGVGGESVVETKSSPPPPPKPRERPAWFDEIQPEEGILRILAEGFWEYKNKKRGYMFEPESFSRESMSKVAAKIQPWAEPDWLRDQLEALGEYAASQIPGYWKAPHLVVVKCLYRHEAEMLRVQRQRRIDAEMDARNAQRNAPDDDWKRQFHVMAGGSA